MIMIESYIVITNGIDGGSSQRPPQVFIGCSRTKTELICVVGSKSLRKPYCLRGLM